MKVFIILVFGLFATYTVSAQNDAADSDVLKIYRAAATRINDLVHTKLEVKPDYDKSYLYGKAWITLKPHWYPTDSLELDARAMDIHSVSLVSNNTSKPLNYKYDSFRLNIRLNRKYTRNESYTILVDYTAKPNELKDKITGASNDSMGLYFINPKGAEKGKPIQLWTQGEPEANSGWFPTIDKPNQKCTEEIILTVPSKYVTLSNGLLISQKKNSDGTRTDDWKMDLPNAPYLFFFGVGDYSIVKDHYKDKEVNYYVEPAYESVAKRIFGNTPEMMGFYSRILGIEFPWPKYSQMTARDYVAGAMENTSATLHSNFVQQDARELSEGNRAETTICHELFHQWFGDLATTESWSNLTVNESFADFSETLWTTYKEGKDAGDAENYQGVRTYLFDSSNQYKNLVRYHYAAIDDMFDGVTYAKGGRILNMLRNYVGDTAFFKSLNLYLTNRKFKSGNATDLRLAFEEITGQDLNWYWNQWYYSSGHPKFTMDYKYDDAAGKATVIIRQTQNTGKIFRVPLAIDVYEGTSKTRHAVWIENQTDTFDFSYKVRPSLINVDGDKIILCEKKDNKTIDNFIYQYSHAGLYLDRLEAIEYCAKTSTDPKATELLKLALKDPYPGLRRLTLMDLNMKNDTTRKVFEPAISDIAGNDPDRRTKGSAIEILGSYKNPAYKTVFVKGTEDSSYTVAGNSLTALEIIDSTMAFSLAKKYSKEPSKGRLLRAITTITMKYGDESDFEVVTKNFQDILATNNQTLRFCPPYIKYLEKVKNTDHIKESLKILTDYRKSLPPRFQKQMDTYIDKPLKQLADKKEAEGLKEQADYIKSVLK
jgi:aminopeptidase N